MGRPTGDEKTTMALQHCNPRFGGLELLVEVPLWIPLHNFQSSKPTLSYQAPHLLNHRHWCHLANILKHTTTNISTSGIAIVSMLDGYSRQRRIIGCFSSTAGILINTSCCGSQMWQTDRQTGRQTHWTISSYSDDLMLTCFSTDII